MANARREDVSSAQRANPPDTSELHRYPAPFSIPSLLNWEAEQPQSERQTLSKVTDSTQSTSTAEIDGHPSLAAGPTVCTNTQAERGNMGLFLPSTYGSEHNDLTPRTLPPLPSSPPRPESLIVPQDNYRPPAVEFTIDNRVESALVDVRPLLEEFQRHVQVVIRADGMPSQETVYHAGFLVGQTSPDFYKWYMAVSGIDDVSFLRFELTDVHCSSKMVFIIAGGNVYDFQVLKQYIWDLFWLTSHAHGTPVKFNIMINPVGHLSSALRTASDQQSLRSTAEGLIAGRVNIELEDHEITGQHIRVYPDVCGVVIDKRSARGWVVVTGGGFPNRQVKTGEGAPGNPFLELAIRVGQTCEIHGKSTVLYYRCSSLSHSE